MQMAMVSMEMVLGGTESNMAGTLYISSSC